MTLCFATNNQHKLAEVRLLLPKEISLVSLVDIGCSEELPEEQNTISGNSFQKATYVFEKYRVSCFADDSGLEVDALGGMPGVDSAHYAGPQRNFDDNMNLLLASLTGVTKRHAHFKTVITLITQETKMQFEGILSGEITNEKRGNAGFGYDPIFLPNGNSLTIAQMTMDQKNAISHRAMAVKKLVEFLTGNLALRSEK